MTTNNEYRYKAFTTKLLLRDMRFRPRLQNGAVVAAKDLEGSDSFLASGAFRFVASEKGRKSDHLPLAAR